MNLFLVPVIEFQKPWSFLGNSFWSRLVFVLLIRWLRADPWIRSGWGLVSGMTNHSIRALDFGLAKSGKGKRAGLLSSLPDQWLNQPCLHNKTSIKTLDNALCVGKPTDVLGGWHALIPKKEGLEILNFSLSTLNHAYVSLSLSCYSSVYYVKS